MSVGVVACASCGRKNRVPGGARGIPRCGSCHADLPWKAVAGDADWGPVVEDSPVPVLVDFWADWCGPCRQVSPVLEQLASEMAGRVKLVKVDVDAAPGLSRRFEMRGIPTLLVTDRGRVVARRTGAAGVDRLRAWLVGALSELDSGRDV